MKKLFLYLPLLLLSASCIQEEPLNAEADILACTVMNKDGVPDKNIKGDPSIQNWRVIVQATPNIDLTKLAPVFKLTSGAKVSPESGTLLDFSTPQKYTVTSEDGKWSKEYTVSVDTFRMPLKYGFENYEISGGYQLFYELIQIRDIVFKQYIWASGNGGYALTGVAQKPEDYPTVAAPGEGLGKTTGLRLVTKSTGRWGAGVKMPIAAGNMFIGTFDALKAMSNPLGATLFGLPFDRKPVTLKGHYKYKAGDVFKKFEDNDRSKSYITDPNRVDQGDIYAVLYESTSEMPKLNGSNVLDYKTIVAIARVQNVKDVNDYVSFEVGFEYGAPGHLPFDKQKLLDYKYNLAVVFTSSIDGAYFAGAEGSMLMVDNVEIVCENIK